MRAFVTGGTGFVGSHLVEELLRRGYEVRCLVRSDPKWLGGLGIVPVRGDLFDERALTEGVRGADLVFHVAGLTRAATPEALDRVNVTGTLNLLAAVRRAAPEVQRVVVTSSLAACGPSGAQPLKEAEPLEPVSHYGRSKARMEEAVRRRFMDPGAGDRLPVTIVRPPAVYGPREADIFTLIRAADKQRIFPVVGKGDKSQLSLVHVHDLVRGMADAAETRGTAGQTYFIGSEAYYAWNEIREAVLGALGHGALKLNVPRAFVKPVGSVVERVGGLFGQYPALNREKAGEATASWLCSVAKARQAFGYKQTVEVEEGMAETVAWYRRHGWL